MTDQTIRFDDGASYEIMMGRWSLIVGARFIDWIAVPGGQRWVDIGCGNGAFTERLVERCAPVQVHAFDPSEGQLAYARSRLPAGTPVVWAQGDAMKLPLEDGCCDAATMALVLFFVPDPRVGLAEMVRVLRPGGVAAAYHWDILNGGFPLAAIGAEMMKLGVPPRMPPSASASTLEASEVLWKEAGLQDVRTTQFTVERQFASFDDYWHSAANSSSMKPMFEALPAGQLEDLKANVRQRLEAGDGPLTVSARANAICGIKP
ncbi:class I SAM-dependent methyltransferase [Paucibacter sp. JuS9]|uniref:class I SAM-dependent methyltransferase n=1 Tax=Paucibacter sp. JuS9 TaxID=3228748 RepID=UPI003757A215